ncbi:MAG: hypothetical protein WCD37_14935 [Chloroflexia bacterium]
MGYRTERIFVLTAIVVVGLALVLAVSRGAVGTGGADAEPLLWVMTLVLALVASAGALWVAQGGEAPEDRLTLGRLWILPVPLEVLLPGLLAVGFVLFLRLFESGIAQVVVLALAAASFGAVYWGQAHGSNTKDPYFGLAQTSLNVAAHVGAFLLFTTIYGLKVRSLYSASATGVVAFLLVYELLSRDAAWHKAMSLPVEGRRSTVALLSLVAGLVVGELTWGLNYWAALTTLIGGAFLLVVFYVTHGVLSHYVDHTLDRRLLVEFGVVAGVGIVAVFGSAFLIGE